MDTALESSIIAILNAKGGIVGTGFLVADRLILTCAHVVESLALHEAVNVRYRITDETASATLTQVDDYNDLALLRLGQDRPWQTRPLLFGNAEGLEGKPITSFGYPAIPRQGQSLGGASIVEGLYAAGTLVGVTHLDAGQRVWQVDSNQLTNGFSGAPLVMDGRVVGVVNAAYFADQKLKNINLAFATPIELAQRLDPEIGQWAGDLWPLGDSYPALPNFTGRLNERGKFSRWLQDGPSLLCVTALGGFGKSALAWHWLTHDVDRARWRRAFWWNFYDQRDFGEFVRCALEAFGETALPASPRSQTDRLLERLAQPGALLVLDGFERALRAFGDLQAAYRGDEVDLAPESSFDRSPSIQGGGESFSGAGFSPTGSTPLRLPPSEPHGRGESPPFPLPQTWFSFGGGREGVERDPLSPLAEHFLRSAAARPLRGRVLITTRLRPRPLEGPDRRPLQYASELSLTALSPQDAASFFQSEGICGTRAELEAAGRPYGFHPLSLRLLAGLILTDLHNPGDIAVAQRLNVSGDLVRRQHHVLEQSFNSLPRGQRWLLTRLACFRSPMSYEAIAAVAEQDGHGVEKGSALDAALRSLLTRGLLHRTITPAPSHPLTLSPHHPLTLFDLHPIVRRYAYERLGDKPAAHRVLIVFFQAAETPKRFQSIEELTPLIELYHHTLNAGRFDEARELFRDRLNKALYYQFGAYELQIELLSGLFPGGSPFTPAGAAALPRLKEESAQAWTLNEMANSYSLSGQPRRAIPLFELSNEVDEKQGNKKGVAIGLGNLANRYRDIGTLASAAANLRQSIALCREIEDKGGEGIGHYELGRALAYCGKWDEALHELDEGEKIKKETRHIQGQGIIWAYRALLALLQARVPPSVPPFSPAENRVDSGPEGRKWGDERGVESARRALELADEDARTRYPHERDYVRAHWLLGAALLHEAGDLPQAERHLTEALTRCRAINLVEFEADILVDLARLRRAQALPAEAETFAQAAVQTAERCGYALQAADAHLVLARLAHSRRERPARLAHARRARQWAACDGEPNVYRVAYDEAGRLLEE